MRQSAFGLAAVMDFFEGESEERQGICVFRVTGNAFGKARLHIKADTVGRSFDDLTKPFAWQRIERDFLIGFRRALEELEGIEEIRAHGGQHRQPAAWRPRRLQEAGQHGPRLGPFRRAEYFLELVKEQ